MATRRTTTAKEIGTRDLARRRATNNHKKSVKGKVVSRSPSTAAILSLHASLVPDKHSAYIIQSAAPSSMLSTDILQDMGISVATNSQRRKKDFSLVKTQKTSMVVRNPVILEAYIYKNLPRLPVPANSIFKNQNDAFFAVSNEQKLSRAKRKEMEKYMTPNPVDLTGIVISVVRTVRAAQATSSHPLRSLHTRGKN